MRKKSHISLSKYLIENMKVQGLNKHRCAFYMGSILPDLMPSFLTKRHTIDETFDILIQEIRKVTEDYDIQKGITSFYAKHLGIITHYIADYCTFPHNTIFTGTITEHIHYENSLKLQIREYVKLDEAKRERDRPNSFHTIEEIVQVIQGKHKEYLEALKCVQVDIQYIIDLSYTVADAILRYLEIAASSLFNVDYRALYHVDYSRA